MSYGPPRRRAQTSLRATGRLGACSTAAALVLALAVPAASTAAQPPSSASWNGRAIERPLDDGQVALASSASFPRGWSAGAVRVGTGVRHEGGSNRVREVQKRLWRLGYRPGPVDGIFGLQTKAAVQWFQIKHGFRPTGVVDLATLTHLRERSGAGTVAEAKSLGVPSSGGGDQQRAGGDVPAAPATTAQAQPAAGRQSPADDGGGRFAPAALVALALLLLALPAALVLAALWRRNPPKLALPALRRPKLPKLALPAVRRPKLPTLALPAVRRPKLPTLALPALRRPKLPKLALPALRWPTLPKLALRRPKPPALALAALRRPKPPKQRRPSAPPHRSGAGAPVPQPRVAATPDRIPTIGYVRCADRTEFERHTNAMRQACAARNWKLAGVLRDDQWSGTGKALERPGLAQALERMAAPGRSRLVVSKLSHLSRSASDLMALFEWFTRHDVELVAVDAGLDMTTPAGRRAAHALLATVARRQEQARTGAGNGARATTPVAAAVGPRERGDHD